MVALAATWDHAWGATPRGARTRSALTDSRRAKDTLILRAKFWAATLSAGGRRCLRGAGAGAVTRAEGAQKGGARVDRSAARPRGHQDRPTPFTRAVLASQGDQAAHVSRGERASI